MLRCLRQVTLGARPSGTTCSTKRGVSGEDSLGDVMAEQFHAVLRQMHNGFGQNEGWSHTDVERKLAFTSRNKKHA